MSQATRARAYLDFNATAPLREAALGAMTRALAHLGLRGERREKEDEEQDDTAHRRTFARAGMEPGAGDRAYTSVRDFGPFATPLVMPGPGSGHPLGGATCSEPMERPHGLPDRVRQ